MSGGGATTVGRSERLGSEGVRERVREGVKE